MQTFADMRGKGSRDFRRLQFMITPDPKILSWQIQNKSQFADISHSDYLMKSSLKFIYSEKANKVLRNLHRRFDWHYIGQIYGGDFAKFCGLLRIYEL